MKKIIFIITLYYFANPSSSAAQNFDGRMVLGEKVAKLEIENSLKVSQKPFYDTLITDNETAIAVAEPILFKIYGKDNIISERPYEIYLLDGYWFISGTLPNGFKGGTFEIIMNSKNGQVIKLIHEK
jgi:NTF2 fold immunity protein